MILRKPSERIGKLSQFYDRALQGYDMVERPLVRADETMTIEADMCLAVYPGYETDSIFAEICDKLHERSGRAGRMSAPNAEADI